MSFEWFVARRYLVARRRQAFVSLISMVSIVGVCVGVMALIIALALMTGVQSELRDRIVGSTAPLQVYLVHGTMDPAAEVAKLRAMPGITGAAPVILGQCAVDNVGSYEPITVKGIDPVLETQVTDLRAAMRSGSLNDLAQAPNRMDGVVLGADLAAKLGVTIGDTIQVYVPNITVTPFGPRMQLPSAFKVVGTFSLGFYQFDSGYAFVQLSRAEQLFAREGPDFIELATPNMDDAPRIRDELKAALGPNYSVQDWTEMNKALYSALSLEKIAISLTIGLIVMVAALNIVASLVLLVMEKSRDIAILRTMGAPAGAIRRVFMYQGLVIGLVGTTVGTMLGLLVSYVANRYRLVPLNADVYQISYLPFRPLPFDVTVVVVAAIGVCYLATLYPSRQAGALDPAEALRNL